MEFILNNDITRVFRLVDINLQVFGGGLPFSRFTITYIELRICGVESAGCFDARGFFPLVLGVIPWGYR